MATHISRKRERTEDSGVAATATAFAASATATAASAAAAASAPAPAARVSLFNSATSLAHMGMVMRSVTSIVDGYNIKDKIMSMAMFHHCPLYLCKGGDMTSRPLFLGFLRLKVGNDPAAVSCKLVLGVLPTFPLLARQSLKFSQGSVRAIVDLCAGSGGLCPLSDCLKGCIVTQEEVRPSDHLWVPWMSSSMAAGLRTLESALLHYTELFAGCRSLLGCWDRYSTLALSDSDAQGLIPTWMKVDDRWVTFMSQTNDLKMPFHPPPPLCYIMGLPEDEVAECFPFLSAESEPSPRSLFLELQNFWCERCVKTVSMTTLDGVLRVSLPALLRMFSVQAGLRWRRSESGALAVWGKRIMSVPFLRHMYIGVQQADFVLQGPSAFLKSCPFGCYRCRSWTLGGQNLQDPDLELRVNTLLMHGGVRPANVRAVCDRVESCLVSTLVAFARTRLPVLGSKVLAHELHDGTWALVHYLRFCNRQAMEQVGNPDRSSADVARLFDITTLDLSRPIYTEVEEYASIHGSESYEWAGLLPRPPPPPLLSPSPSPSLHVVRSACGILCVSALGSCAPAPQLTPCKHAEDMKFLRAVFSRAIEQRCPVCSARYKLDEGCTHVVCTECGNHFCHTCSRRFLRSVQPRTLGELSQALGVRKPSDVLHSFATNSTLEALLKFWVRKCGDKVGDLPRHHPRFSTNEGGAILHASLAGPFTHSHDKRDWEFGECPLYVASFLSEHEDEDEEEDEEEEPFFLHRASSFSILRFCKEEDVSMQLGELGPRVVVNPYDVLGSMMNRQLGNVGAGARSDDMQTGLSIIFRLCNMLFLELFKGNPMDGSVMAQLLQDGRLWLEENNIVDADQLKNHELCVRSFMGFLHFSANEHTLVHYLVYTLIEMSHTHNRVCTPTADANCDPESLALVDHEIAQCLAAACTTTSAVGERGIPSFSSVILTNILDSLGAFESVSGAA